MGVILLVSLPNLLTGKPNEMKTVASSPSGVEMHTSSDSDFFDPIAIYGMNTYNI